MELRLYRIILPVNDIEKAFQFYRELFEQKGMRVSPGRHYFTLGQTVLACYDPEADGDEIGTGWKLHYNQYIYIATSDIEKIFDQWTKLGAKHISQRIESMPWGETLFYALDPFNNRLCFVKNDTIFTG